MQQTYYIWSSMFGTFHIECEVLDQDDKRILIQYHDPLIESQITCWVDKDRVVFKIGGVL